MQGTISPYELVFIYLTLYSSNAPGITPVGPKWVGYQPASVCNGHLGMGLAKASCCYYGWVNPKDMHDSTLSKVTGSCQSPSGEPYVLTPK